MAKIRKAVFRSGIVMLSLLAAIVLSSSVAYAQRCEARAATGDRAVRQRLRAEGMTEAVGASNCGAGQFRARRRLCLSDFTFSVTLNTPITSLR